jgi:RNA polymerase sigma-70 factor (ECF subfamily)
LVDETDLIARLRAADPRAQRAFYDAHVDRIYRLAYRLTGDDELARDFTQEAFIRAFSRIEQFRGDAAIGTWLHAIAARVVMNGMRRVNRFRRREVALDEAGATAGPARSAEPDLRQRLHRAIDALPEKYRVVFVMHDVEGYTHEEIGGALGMPPGTSKAQLSRARARLRESLAAFAGEWAS